MSEKALGTARTVLFADIKISQLPSKTVYKKFIAAIAKASVKNKMIRYILLFVQVSQAHFSDIAAAGLNKSVEHCLSRVMREI
ncbi:hypothetical protein [Legionella quateirensis]|uniref:Uncharacterized protein n=1 Tax=Legionella quateirensis TaxID=45072 RepID=A0A378KSZ1_9GAMM|nr:hypothetical protein [Legionella quateirensis]KTD55433.1 hypothetical protein Lqua_0150 [Legionella quateirensis]STY16607.1 Uncharacterised protein [Legionella quateirensis]